MPLRLPKLPVRLWLALLVLALGGVLAVIEQRGVTLPGPVPSDGAGEPDFYLENARMTRFDEQGNPHQRLDTPRLVHTPEDDVTRAVTPRLRIYDAAGRTWFASGQAGTLGAGGNLLTLQGDARLEAPGQGWRLTTDVLVYDGDTRHAWSESEVLLRQFEQRIRGERFDAWIDTSRMRLAGNVRGHHPPISERPDS